MASADEARHSQFLVPPENRIADFASLFSPSSDGGSVSRIVGAPDAPMDNSVQHTTTPASGNGARSSHIGRDGICASRQGA